MNFAGFKGCTFTPFANKTLTPLTNLEQGRATLGNISISSDWINLGGGHHCTREDYDQDGLIELIDEISQKYELSGLPGTWGSRCLGCGYSCRGGLDLMNSNAMHALLDLSATCHAPDVIEAPYRPALIGDIEDGHDPYLLGGASCLTADSFGSTG